VCENADTLAWFRLSPASLTISKPFRKSDFHNIFQHKEGAVGLSACINKTINIIFLVEKRLIFLYTENI